MIPRTRGYCRDCQREYERARLAAMPKKKREAVRQRSIALSIAAYYARTPQQKAKHRKRSLVYAARWRKKHVFTKAEREERARYCREWRKRTGWKPSKKKRNLDVARAKMRIKTDPIYAAKVRAHSRASYHRRKHLPEFRAKRASYSLKSKKNPYVRLILNLRRRLHLALCGIRKADTTFVLLGCNRAELRRHLENQFREGMTWKNYGIGGWSMDHIKPCAIFDLSDPEQQRRCFHFTNLQPLWESENSSKKHKYDSKA